MTETLSVQVGTSGWHYKHWKEKFYPLDLDSGEWLAYYQRSFQTVEVNNSFYQLPSTETFDQWYTTINPSFKFAIKASRYITHMKKLTDPHNSTAKFFDHLAHLRDKIGPILFQLPPRWHANPERLQAFLTALPSQYCYAFEFRDPSWFLPVVYEILSRFGAAFCIYDFNRRTSPDVLTADFVYLRLHGPDGPYQGSYSSETLQQRAQAIFEWQQQGRDVYCYFDNDTAANAVQNALELKRIVGQGS